MKGLVAYRPRLFSVRNKNMADYGLLIIYCHFYTSNKYVMKTYGHVEFILA